VVVMPTAAVAAITRATLAPAAAATTPVRLCRTGHRHSKESDTEGGRCDKVY
jgi:hypothetical protein